MHVSPPGTSRVGPSVFFVIFGAFICFFMFMIAKDFTEPARYAQWLPAAATPVQNNQDADALHYTYVSQGKTFKGKAAGEKARWARNQSGLKLVCRVNPQNPADSVLFWSLPVGKVLIGLSFMLAFSGFFFGFVCVFLFQGKRIAPWFTGLTLLHLGYALFIYQALANTPDDVCAARESLSKAWVILPSLVLFLISLFVWVTRRKIKGKWAMLLFPLPFLAGGLFLAWLSLNTVAGVEKRLAWVEAPAKIIDQNVKSQRSSGKNKSTTYRVQGTFRYTFEGKEYIGDSIDGSNASDNVGAYHRDVAALMKRAQKAGKGLTCRVNPADPSEAVLFNWVRPEMIAFQALFVYTFPTIGVLLFFYFVLLFWRENRAAKTGAACIDNRPQALMLTVIGLADTLFFAWILSRMAAFPPEAIYGGGVPAWLNLAMAPGIGFMIGGFAWLWRGWPRRKVAFERAAGGFVAGSFVFPGAPGESAVIRLEAKKQEKRGRHSQYAVAWEEEQSENRIFCDGVNCRLGFTFQDPGEEREGLTWQLILTLTPAPGKSERYRFYVVPEAPKAETVFA